MLAGLGRLREDGYSYRVKDQNKLETGRDPEVKLKCES
jgi:hypothetical protein